MESGTRTIAIVVLAALILIGGALVFRTMRGGSFGGPTPPPEVLARTMEFIDKNTLEAETLSLGEWMKRGSKDGKYKNKAGEYTMVSPLTCASCGAKIPVPDMPAGPDASPEAYDRIMMEYKCPKCGKPAQSDLAAPPAERAPAR